MTIPSDSTDLLVLTACTSEGGNLPRYREQLSLAGIPLHIESLSAGPTDASIATMLTNLRRRAEQFSRYSRLIMTDGWDVNFFGTREAVIETMDRIIPSGGVLWAAEKNCFPDAHMSGPVMARWPDRGPWFYANGGMVAGTPQNIYDWTFAIEQTKLYAPFFVNQGFFNILLAAGEEVMQVDWKTELFICLHLGYQELEFEKGRMINTKWGTHPLWAHANGCWPTDELWAKYHRSLQ